jgi:hypothetical protein
MKKLIAVSGLTMLLIVSFAQNTPGYSAMILDLQGEGIMKRGNEEIPLELPQRYMPGDVLRVRQGNAIVMLFSGLEVPLSAVSDYTIPAEEVMASNELQAMANTDKEELSLLSQSGTAYRIRGESIVFPRTSKVLKPENMVLRINTDSMPDFSWNLRIIDAFSQKEVYRQENITDSLVSLAEAPLLDGKSYYYLLGNMTYSKPEMGSIIIAKKNEQMSDFPDNPVDHYTNLSIISAYYNKKYYFAALNYIEACIERYPEFEIYRKMMDNLLAE